MRLKILFFAAPLIIPYMAFASATWPNEPAGSHQFLDCPFNSLAECGMKDNYSSAAITTDASAFISPSNVMKSTIRPGASSGGVEVHYFTPQINRELYVGLLWRTNPQFQGRPVGNKLFFVRGPGVNGVFNFNDAALLGGQGQMIWGANTSGYDNSQACSAPLGATCRPNVSSGILSVGVWTKIEVYLKASTTMTSRDGIVRWWINGARAGDYTNINYAPKGLNEWVWAETWDGYVNPTPAVEWSHYVDHLYISAPNFVLSVPKITSDTIPSFALSGKSYSAYLKAMDGYPGYTWTISSGSLPGGLVLGEKTGVISGIPSTCGPHNFTVKVTDAKNSTATKTYSLNVTGTCTSGMKDSRELRVVSEKGMRIESRTGRLRFYVPQQGQYHLNIHDLSGKEVYTSSGSGRDEVRINTVLRNGVYLAKLRQGSQTSLARFQVLD